MLARLRPRVTFANVCSFLALLIALGTGSAYAANTVFSTDIVDGEVKTADLANNAVRSNKIGAGQVKAPDIAADAVASANVVNESLTASDLGTDSVQATEVANDSIDSGEIANDSLFASDLGPASVTASELQDGAVGNVDLASNAVTGAKVAGNTLTTADIAGADVNGGGISVPTGYVPNGRCTQLDANVSGADGGRGAWCSRRTAPLQNGVLIYGQRVASDGHVTFDVCNFTGATQAQINDLPVRVITFG